MSEIDLNSKITNLKNNIHSPCLNQVIQLLHSNAYYFQVDILDYFLVIKDIKVLWH